MFWHPNLVQSIRKAGSPSKACAQSSCSPNLGRSGQIVRTLLRAVQFETFRTVGFWHSKVQALGIKVQVGFTRPETD